MTDVLRVKNWSKYQGYQKRGPGWIKLYASLLDDPGWISLPVEAKALLPALWIAASRQSTAGTLPAEIAMIAMLARTTENLVKKGLPPLISFGFIQCDGSVAGLATKVSGEKRRDREETETEQLPLPPLQAESSQASATDPDKAIQRFNVAFRRSFNRPKAGLPPDKAPVFAERIASGYAVDFLVGLPVACRAAGLDKGKEVQPEFLLRNGSGHYTRGGDTRKTFDWIGSLYQAADRVRLSPLQAQILHDVGAFEWWAAKGATVIEQGIDEC